MGIRKSKITPSINVDDMLKKAEISHEIETEKLDVDKRLKEICEIKETLLKIQQDLQDAIKAEGNASVVLKKAISNSNSIVNGICNAITKAERNTQFKATIKSEHLAQLQQLLDKAIETWKRAFVYTFSCCRPFLLPLYFLIISLLILLYWQILIRQLKENTLVNVAV